MLGGLYAAEMIARCVIAGHTGNSCRLFLHHKLPLFTFSLQGWTALPFNDFAPTLPLVQYPCRFHASFLGRVDDALPWFVETSHVSVEFRG